MNCSLPYGLSICLLTASLIVPDLQGLAAESAAVQFDAPAIVVAEPINPAVVQQPTMGGELMRLKIPVSTFVSSAYRGRVIEYVVEVASTNQSMRMLDYWPKNESYSELDGNVSVERQQQRDRDLKFSLSAAYEPFGRGQAAGEFKEHSQVQERFERKPPMQVLTAAGTSGRGYGAFFKFRPGPLPVLEGAREIAILVEVPQGWRADLLQIAMHAAGSTRQDRVEPIGTARLWIATHREGDLAAAAAARRYVTQERSLRALAASNQPQVEARAHPNILHKFGAALDVVDPRIPHDYLTHVLFGSSRLTSVTNRLPVDLRVAILDYWEERETLAGLAYQASSAAVEQHIVAKPISTESLP